MDAPVTIVTGAGSGIGREVCRMLFMHGWRVALAGRDQAKLAETAELVLADSLRESMTAVIPADISDRPQAQSLVEQTLQRWGRIDVLINNAAVLHVRPVSECDENAWRETLAVNVLGPAYLIASCWPAFQRQRSGRIINVSSMSSVDPFTGLSMYAASKAALESMTRSINVEGGDSNIRAFSVVPGSTETPMLRKIASREELPSGCVMSAAQPAEVIVACALGQRDDDAGEPIIVEQAR